MLLAVTSVAACGQIPGTDDYKIGLAREAAAESLIDPTSALFQNVKVNERGDAVCGEINGKNRMGAYVGFTRFYAEDSAGDFIASLEPEFDFDYLASIEQSCRQMERAVWQSRANGYDPGDLAASVCREAKELSEQRARQFEWSDRWEELCVLGNMSPEEAAQERKEREASIREIEKAAAKAAAAADAAVADLQ